MSVGQLESEFGQNVTTMENPCFMSSGYQQFLQGGTFQTAWLTWSLCTI